MRECMRRAGRSHDLRSTSRMRFVCNGVSRATKICKVPRAAGRRLSALRMLSRHSVVKSRCASSKAFHTTRMTSSASTSRARRRLVGCESAWCMRGAVTR